MKAYYGRKSRISVNIRKAKRKLNQILSSFDFSFLPVFVMWIIFTVNIVCIFVENKFPSSAVIKWLNLGSCRLYDSNSTIDLFFASAVSILFYLIVLLAWAGLSLCLFTFQSIATILKSKQED